ncbi:hypothetical protein MVEN_00176500 [Mycena venus]|uniref:Ricin B lectin domain-containing protein n=1 Tax=Mycena venus TaxID=2733690 RepID=A0A8H7DD43_9AGAR|nr:hypothetical protein MVEN_00176500 [Mycena venus]
MFSLASITIACILGGVSGTSLARQETCSPNFEGAGVTIVTGDMEFQWAVSPVVAGTPLKKNGAPFPQNSTARWHVKQTGLADPTYIVSTISDNKLVVDVVDKELTLEQIDSSKQTQIWEIQCKQCLSGASSTRGGGVFASGCSIKSVPSGLCATLDMGSEFLELTDCNPRGAQTFNFWTATTAERSLEPQNLDKRCDMDFFEDCIGTCNNPTCPACNVGCTIGCCGSTGCC